MTERPLSRAELRRLADQLSELLAKVVSGELDATAATRYRLEGALVALAAALGRPSGLLDLTSRPGLDNK